MTFDWEPSTPSGAMVALSNRGSDPRLARSARISAAQRKTAKLARRDGTEEQDEADNGVSTGHRDPFADPQW
jgi:GTP-binding protein